MVVRCGYVRKENEKLKDGKGDGDGERRERASWWRRCKNGKVAVVERAERRENEEGSHVSM